MKGGQEDKNVPGILRAPSNDTGFTIISGYTENKQLEIHLWIIWN